MGDLFTGIPKGQHPEARREQKSIPKALPCCRELCYSQRIRIIPWCPSCLVCWTFQGASVKTAGQSPTERSFRRAVCCGVLWRASACLKGKELGKDQTGEKQSGLQLRSPVLYSCCSTDSHLLNLPMP